MVKDQTRKEQNNQRICSRCGITFNELINACPICDKQLNIPRGFQYKSLKKITKIWNQFVLKKN